MGPDILVRRHDIFAVDDDERHLLGVERLGLLERTVHFAGHGKRVVHLLDLLAVEAVARSPVEERFLIFEFHALAVNGDEYFRRKARILAEGFQRVVLLRERHPLGLEADGDTAKLDIGRQLLDPFVQQRLELAAMRTAIGKEFDHLDLVARLDGNRILEPHVFAAFLGCCGLRHRG